MTPPAGPALPRPHDIEERDAIELMDETETWNAAIEAAAAICDKDAKRYAHIGNLRYDSLAEEAQKLWVYIRALKRPVTP